MLKEIIMAELLTDYIRWRGDLSFEQSPFNEIDNLILSEMCYLDLVNVLKRDGIDARTFRECYEQIVEKDCYRLLTVNGGNQDFIEAAAFSKRFGDLTVCQFTDVIDEKTQFSAMHFILNDSETYIAFRGTDSSIVGWKEDFMMSFTRIPAQEQASQYTSMTMEPGRIYYLGGHSKGANLAAYAGCHLEDEKLFQVHRIFMNDGPGFCSDVYDLIMLDRIRDKVVCIVPEYDVIGQMFACAGFTQKIVGSAYSGIMQHDIVSWCVSGPHLDLKEELDQGSVFINEVISRWVEELDHEDRMIFVSEFFDALAAGGAQRLEEITSKGKMNLLEVAKAMISTSEQAKKAVMNLPKSAVDLASDQVREMIAALREKTKKEDKNAEG